MRITQAGGPKHKNNIDIELNWKKGTHRRRRSHRHFQGSSARLPCSVFRSTIPCRARRRSDGSSRVYQKQKTVHGTLIKRFTL